MVMETERLVESRRLLEAHAKLMDLEYLQDDILWQLNKAAGGALSTEDQEVVAKYFSGVRHLVDALGEELIKIRENLFKLNHHFLLKFLS